jgi:hypothetical protein
MSSRRKMSLLLYRLLMRMSIRRDTSAWNSYFSALSRGLRPPSASLRTQPQQPAACGSDAMAQRRVRAGARGAGKRIARVHRAHPAVAQPPRVRRGRERQCAGGAARQEELSPSQQASRRWIHLLPGTHATHRAAASAPTPAPTPVTPPFTGSLAATPVRAARFAAAASVALRWPRNHLAGRHLSDHHNFAAARRGERIRTCHAQRCEQQRGRCHQAATPRHDGSS